MMISFNCPGTGSPHPERVLDRLSFTRRVEGFANAAFKAKNQLDTKFNLGSNNKMFTAVATAQLEEQGKLAYTDKVSKYLPDFPHPDVTLPQLLTHSSGLGSYFTAKFAAAKDRIEKITGHSYDDCIRDHVTGPAGMTSSSCLARAAPREAAARPRPTC
jgi:CubicO group peptidase (beta-lactamase class C family)